MIFRNFLSTKRISSTAGSFAFLLLRICLGGMMVLHGVPKLLNFSAMSAGFDPIGLGGTLSVALVVFAEIVCALAIVFGFLTRVASIPLVINMSVAAFVAHASHPLVSAGGPSMELAVIYLVFFTATLFAGPGKFSVDKMMFR